MTSSSKTFVLVLSSLMTLLFISLVGTAIYLEPLSGDLTRLGGYSENDFGWKKEQQKVAERLVDYKPGKQYYDVVVLGDSFSYDNESAQTHHSAYWQNFFANETGLTVVTYDVNQTKLKDIVLSESFRESPPKIFIFEYVERDLTNLPLLLAENKLAKNCEIIEKVSPNQFKVTNSRIPIQNFNRSLVFANSTDEFPFFDLSYAADFLRKNFSRNVLQWDDVRAKILTLKSNDSFSSHVKNRLLVFDNDFRKLGWKPKVIEDAICVLKTIQNYVQQNGMTYFAAMIAPDKSSAYAEYLIDEQYKDMSQLDVIADSQLNLIKVHTAIKASINSGEIDVYLPNDTHWGSTGHRVAAEYVKDYLLDRGVIVY